MIISRRGTTADHGVSGIEFKSPKFKWDEKRKCISVSERGVGDFSTSSRHDYTVNVSLDELKSMLMVVGEIPVNDSPKEVSEALSPCMRSLLRIISVCIGKVGILSDDQGKDA